MAEQEGRGGKRRRWIIILGIVLGLTILAGLVALVKIAAGRLPREDLVYNQGIVLRNTNKTAQAIEKFRQALKIDPQHRPARMALIHTLTVRKEFGTALDEIDQALEQGLPAHEAAELKARVLLSQSSHRVSAAGESATAGLVDSVIRENVSRAIDLMQAHMNDFEDPASAYTFLGTLYGQKTKLLYTQQALLRKERYRLEQADRDKQAAAIQVQIDALAPKIKTGRHEHETAYIHAIELDPYAEEPRLELARFALTAYEPQTDRAEAALEPLLKQNPNHERALALQARAQRLAGDYERALESFRALRKNAPNDRALMQNEAELLLELERWEEASLLIKEMAQLWPSDMFVLYLQGKILEHENRIDDAVNSLQTIFANYDVQWPQARLALARGLDRLGKQEQAIQTYQAVLQDVRSDTLGNIKAYTEQREAAYEANFYLARQLKLVSGSNAIQHAQNALRLFPEREKAADLVQETFRAAGR